MYKRQDSTFSGGTITIKDNSKVTAIGSNGFSQNTSCSNPAIGASEKANPDYNPAKAPMNGTITITDNAQVKIGSDTKFGTSRTPLIGEASSEPTGTGKIEISGNAAVSNIDGSSDIAIGGGTASSTIDISIGANTNINGTKGSDILDGKSSNVKLNTVKTPTLVPESAPADASERPHPNGGYNNYNRPKRNHAPYGHVPAAPAYTPSPHG